MGLGGRITMAAAVAGTLVACAAPGTAPERQAGAGGPSGTATRTAPVTSGWASCEAAGAPMPARTPGGSAPPISTDQQGQGRLPDSFVPVAVTLCGTTHAARPDGGENVVASERRTGDRAAVDALAAALRLPDAPATAEVCAAYGVVVPWFVLHDADGGWVRPGSPLDECRRPRAEVMAALEALPLTPVSETVVGESRSALSARTGCEDAFADMIWMATGPDAARPPVAEPPPADAEMRLCLYVAAVNVADDGKPGAKRPGTLDAAALLTAPEWAALRGAFPAPVAAGPCPAPAARFALLQRVDTGGVHVVELDGCRRTMREGAGIAAGGPSLTAAIEAAAG